MDIDTLIGIILVVCALSAITLLVLWSRRTINRIADKNLRSLREIMKDRRGE